MLLPTFVRLLHSTAMAGCEGGIRISRCRFQALELAAECALPPGGKSVRMPMGRSWCSELAGCGRVASNHLHVHSPRWHTLQLLHARNGAKMAAAVLANACEYPPLPYMIAVRLDAMHVGQPIEGVHAQSVRAAGPGRRQARPGGDCVGLSRAHDAAARMQARPDVAP